MVDLNDSAQWPPDSGRRVASLLAVADAHEAGERWGDAANAYVEALTIDPDSAEAAFGLGRMWVRAGHFAGALEYLMHAVELEPEDGLYWGELGGALCRAGHLEEGLAAFEAALESDPLEERRFVDIAKAKFRLHRFEEVVAYTSAMPQLLDRHQELVCL
jgi:tetratricopeptide (TPR) repeat protein